MEGSIFFNELKKYFVVYSFTDNNFSHNNSNTKNILLVENVNINLLACFLKKSILSISSHSGATVHISAAFDVPIIDFIKKSKANEYDRWIPPNVYYRRAFVDKLENLENEINKKLN